METVIPAALAAMGAPIVMPPRITVIAPGVIVLPPTVRTTELAPVAPLLAILLGPMTTGVTPSAKKPVGSLTVMVPPTESAVAVVKLMVMDLPVAPGTRSVPEIDRVTPVTCPNITPATDTWNGDGTGVVPFNMDVPARKVPVGVETSITNAKYGDNGSPVLVEKLRVFE